MRLWIPEDMVEPWRSAGQCQTVTKSESVTHGAMAMATPCMRQFQTQDMAKTEVTVNPSLAGTSPWEAGLFNIWVDCSIRVCPSHSMLTYRLGLGLGSMSYVGPYCYITDPYTAIEFAAGVAVACSRRHILYVIVFYNTFSVLPVSN